MPASIYVADDEPALRNALVKRLTQSQHHVQAFQSGDELLAAVEKSLHSLPDLILLDLKMPGKTGMETLEALRTKAKDALVIVLTSYGTVEEAVEAMKLGAYDFVIKAVDIQLVDPVVTRALDYLALRALDGERTQNKWIPDGEITSPVPWLGSRSFGLDFCSLAALAHHDTEMCGSIPRPVRVKRAKGGTMVMRRGGITLLVGLLAVLQITTGVALAEGQKNTALRLLLDKGIITQQEYDQAVQEEERVKVEEAERAKIEEEKRAKVEEEKRAKQGNFFTKNGLQVRLGGFAEFDFISDSTQSFQELVGNRPVLRSNTVNGANSQTFFSPRNSRIILDVRAPERDGIKSRLFLSMDFLGNQPAVGTSTVTEFSQMTSPDLRIFQLFFLAETPVVDVKVGQDWSRFGFMSLYSRGQVSTAVTPANMFNRWIQFSLSKQLQVTDSLSLTPVFSVERPPQANGTMPSFVAGVQIAHNSLKAPYNGAQAADTSLRSLSLQVSGVGRRLEANTGGPTNAAGGQPGLSSQTHVTGWGVSTSLFLPVLPSKNGEFGNTAHVVMEGVTGAGIADFFNGLSWGVCSPVCGFTNNSGFGGPTFGQTNIDYGLAAVSSQTGTFEAIRTTSMMVHATYYLPDNGKTWVGGGYGTVYSSNAAQMTCITSPTACGGAVRTLSSIYDRESTYYGYLYHDFTQEIRMGLETNFTRTSYADKSNAENRRVMVSLYWRF